MFRRAAVLGSNVRFRAAGRHGDICQGSRSGIFKTQPEAVSYGSGLRDGWKRAKFFSVDVLPHCVKNSRIRDPNNVNKERPCSSSSSD